MNPEINTALVVLGVGMITVFFILGLVVLSGDMLIRIVNKFFPAASIKSPLKSSGDYHPTKTPKKNDPATIAAIVATVDLFTGGKGKVKDIEKLN